MADYLESCVQVIQQLVRVLESYLGIPEKRIQFRDEEGKDKPVHEAIFEIIQTYYQNILHTILENGESPLKLTYKARKF